VAVTAPSQGQNLLTNSNITFSASASTTRGSISWVNFYVNGSYWGQAKKAPYSITTSWNVPVTWTITAMAYDTWGDESTSAPVTANVVDDVAPVVSITSPSDGATFPAKPTITLSASATSEYSTIQSVSFYQGATLLKKVANAPYNYTWTKPAAGTYTLTAVATDAQTLATTSAPVTITVQ
jgi:hypothetical protein